MTKNEMLDNLKRLGVTDAIADENAMSDNAPAILLRWNGKEEYYTGKDIYQPGDDPHDPSREYYAAWLSENFG